MNHGQCQLLDRRGCPHEHARGNETDQHEREIFDGRLPLIHAWHATESDVTRGREDVPVE